MDMRLTEVEHKKILRFLLKSFLDSSRKGDVTMSQPWEHKNS